MDLYILRHAPAAKRTPASADHDSERPLTRKGVRKMRRVASAMARMKPGFDLILSSPFVRARHTAEIAAAALKAKNRIVLTPHLASGGSPAKLIRQIHSLETTPEALLLVGHEPDLSSLISLLLTGKTSLEIAFKKAGLCKLTVENLRSGKCAVLDWLLTPDQMIAMR